MFRKLEEMSRVRPVAVQSKHQPARLDYFKGKKLGIACAVNISSCVSVICALTALQVFKCGREVLF